MSTETLRVLVVDDEQLARARILELLKGIEDVECVGEATNGIEAVEKIGDLAPDLVILDIQMPGMNGFEVVEALNEPPLIIFATAYDEYAIRAFEVNSIDYLLKPIEKDRLAEAIDRARERIEGGPGLGDEIERLAGLIRTRGIERLPAFKGKRIILVDIADIVWIGASDELVFVHTKEDRYLVNPTLAELEKRLDTSVFFRTHRSSIVNLNHVLEIVPWFSGTFRIVVDDAERSELVLSRARAKSLREIFPW